MSREQQITNHMRRCNHFTGMSSDTCAAGVEYQSVKDESTKPFRFPCYLNEPSTRPCVKAVYPTQAEAEQEEAEAEESYARIGKIRKVIIESIQDKRSVHGHITCPCCGGTVGFTRASNGHVHAACSTKGCARWMECDCDDYAESLEPIRHERAQ